MKKNILLVSILFFLFIFYLKPVFAISGDLNNDNRIDITDFRQAIKNFLSFSSFNSVIANFGKIISPTPTPTTLPTPSNILWSAGMETGDKSEWDNGGGEFNSGTAESLASQDFAHTGLYSIKMTISTPPESAVRLFNWKQSQTHNELYYSTWFYFPRIYLAPNYWNIIQWKSKTSSNNDPFYILNVDNKSDGTMFFYLYDWQRQKSYTQSLKTIPVGQWMHVEAFYKCAPDSTGQVTIWQDGTKLFDVTGASTRYSDGDCQWSVDNYSDSLSPVPTTIYADDAQISLTFIP